MGSRRPNWQSVMEAADIPLDSEIPAFSEYFVNDIDNLSVPLFYPDLLEEKIQLDADLKRIEERRKWVGDQLMMLMASAEVDKVKIRDRMILKIGHGTSPSKIEPTKLLEQGVTVDQIQAATVPGNPYSYVQIVRPKS